MIATQAGRPAIKGKGTKNGGGHTKDQRQILLI